MKVALRYVVWLSACTGIPIRAAAGEDLKVNECTPDGSLSSSISLELSEKQKVIHFSCPSFDGRPLVLAPNSSTEAYTVSGDLCSGEEAVPLAVALPTARHRTIKQGGDGATEKLSIETLPTDADKKICFRCADGAGRALCSVFVTALRSAPQPPNTCASPSRAVWLDAEANSVLTFHCGSRYDSLDPVTVEEGGEQYIFTNRFCDTPSTLDKVLPGASISEVAEPSPPYSDVWKSFQLSIKELPDNSQRMLCYKCFNRKSAIGCRVVITVSPAKLPAAPRERTTVTTLPQTVSAAPILSTCAAMYPLVFTALLVVTC